MSYPFDSVAIESLAPFDPVGSEASSEAFPPATNRGGKSTASTAAAQAHPVRDAAVNCHVDYLSFTFKPLDGAGRWDFSLDNPGELSKKDIAAGLPPQLAAAAFSVAMSLSRIISYMGIQEREGGMFGYRRSMMLTRDGVQAGVIAWGGNGDTVYVSLSGYGVSCVDMVEMHRLVRQLPWVRITRVDLAHDDVQGLRDVDFCELSYKTGGFTNRGRPPSYKVIEGGHLVEGCLVRSAGRTFYVGSRDNGKQLRCYEKGKQMGDSDSPWCRWELELHNVDREIPLDVLLRPDDYMAGAFPVLAHLSEGASKIATLAKTAKIAYQHMIKHARLCYGKLVHVMRDLGETPEQIVDALHKEGVPRRLLIPTFVS